MLISYCLSSIFTTFTRNHYVDYRTKLCMKTILIFCFFSSLSYKTNLKASVRKVRTIFTTAFGSLISWNWNSLGKFEIYQSTKPSWTGFLTQRRSRFSVVYFIQKLLAWIKTKLRRILLITFSNSWIRLNETLKYFLLSGNQKFTKNWNKNWISSNNVVAEFFSML